MNPILLFLIGCSAPQTAPVPAKPIVAVQTAPAPKGDKPYNAKRIYQLNDLRKIDLTSGGHTVHAWVMDTSSRRQEGMMWLTESEVKNDEGMLFAFAQPQSLSFWMHNTVLPLDIAFMDAKGKILNIQKGKPFDETGLPSDGKAQFVLEMKQGEMAKLGIKPNSVVKWTEKVVGDPE